MPDDPMGLLRLYQACVGCVVQGFEELASRDLPVTRETFNTVGKDAAWDAFMSLYDA